jgi:4-carboxymuconolactone decarboxylase
MARIPYLSLEELPQETRQVLQSLAGFVQEGPPNNMMALAASPTMTVRLLNLIQYLLNESTLDPKLRELAILKLTKANGSAYAFSHHVIVGERVGLSKEQIQQLHNYKNSPLYNDLEKLVIQFAEEMTLQGKVDEVLFWKMRRALPLDQLVDLITAIGLWNGMSRIMNAFEIDPEIKSMEALEWSW